MDRKEELRNRIEIVLGFLERVRSKYPILFWGIGGSTARGDFSPESDIDLAIQLEYLVKAKNGEDKSKRWHEFEKWVAPILEEFKNKHGVEIDLEW